MPWLDLSYNVAFRVRVSRRCIGILLLTLIAREALAARDAGVDTSHYQGTNNWSSIKNNNTPNRDFAWTKADEGTTNSFNDSTFITNMNNGTAAGVLMGAYHFAHPESNTATAEAVHFLSVVQPNGPNGTSNYLGSSYLRPVVDIETGNGASVGSANLSDWTNAFINYVINNGGGARVEPLIYCNTNYAQSYFNSTIVTRKLWIANYNYTESQALGTSSPPTGVWAAWSFWQYSSSINLNGVGSNPVDTDVANGDINFVRTFKIQPVPEPAALPMLLLIGVGGLTSRWVFRVKLR
jgi:lysozyme